MFRSSASAVLARVVEMRAELVSAHELLVSAFPADEVHESSVFVAAVGGTAISSALAAARISFMSSGVISTRFSSVMAPFR